MPNVLNHEDLGKDVVSKAIQKAILFCLLSLIVTFGAIYFAYIHISKLSSDMQNKQNLIYRVSGQSQVSSNILRIWQSVGPKYDEINNILPSNTDLLAYTGELTQIAESSGITQNVQLSTAGATLSNLPGTTNNDTTSKNKGSSIDYSINLSGNLAQMISYLQALEEAPFITQINTLNINGSQGLDQNSMGTIGAKLYTYP